MNRPTVYILASQRNGTLYIGVTNNVLRRVAQHKSDEIEGFTKRYHVHVLVHVEFLHTMHEAIAREKQLKGWEREWKIQLIVEANPDWRDLFENLTA